MITIDQAIRGAVRYAETEVIPNLPFGKSIGTGIDIDQLYSLARPKMEGQKITVQIPIFGELRFDVNDLDKLYQYIKEA